MRWQEPLKERAAGWFGPPPSQTVNLPTLGQSGQVLGRVGYGGCNWQSRAFIHDRHNDNLECGPEYSLTSTEHDGPGYQNYGRHRLIY